MIYLYYAFVVVTFFAGFAMNVREGLWNNILLLCYLMLASTVAFGYYQPITIFLDEYSGGQYTYLLDMLVFWGLFALTLFLLKTVGVAISDTRVKFLHPLDVYGGPAVAFLCGVVLAAATAISLHMSPFPKDTMGGALVHEGGVDSPSLISASPDIAFLAAAGMFTAPQGLGGSGQFDPGRWVEDYADRRERFAGVMKDSKAAWELKVSREENR